MTPSAKRELEERTQSWIKENRDKIEIFRGYVPTENLPQEDEVEDLNSWVEDNGPLLDSSVGFKIVEIKRKGRSFGFALIFVKGSSWEGLRIYLEDVFENAKDAEEYVGTLGLPYGWEPRGG